MNLLASFKKKYGPLPAYAWLGVIGAGVVVLRHLGIGGGGAATAPADTATADVGGLPYGPGAFGGGAGGGLDDSGLQPTPQTTADPSLLGPGTPVVYDPTTDTYRPIDTATGSVDPFANDNAVNQAPADTPAGGNTPRPNQFSPPSDATIDFARPGIGGTALVASGSGGRRTSSTPRRPKKTTGTKRPRPDDRAGPHGANPIMAHPPPKKAHLKRAPAKKPAVKPVPVRSTASAHVNAGARAAAPPPPPPPPPKPAAARASVAPVGNAHRPGRQM